MSDSEHGTPQEAPQPLPPPAPAAGIRTPQVVAVVLITLAVAGLATVGYLAWQRGLLGGPAGKAAPQPSPVKVVSVETGDSADDDPLVKLDDSVSGLRPYRTYADALRGFDAELDEVRIETDSPGVLAESTRQQLYAMQDLARNLAASYEDFERRAARDRQPKLQPYQELLRAAYLERMQRFVGLIGDAYAAEQGYSHPVFTAGDTFISAVEQAGLADPAPLRERWLQAVHAREQAGLTARYDDELRELQAHIDKLKVLHREVDELLKAAPEYRVRGGYLGATARNLLEVFDSLATRVEGLVVEFEQYVATLPEEHGSDRIDELVAEFDRLAQEDHFHAFRETYKIYEQDKQLEHPAYGRLKEHYEFVQQHWPSLAGQYRRQFQESETRWASKWAQ